MGIKNTKLFTSIRLILLSSPLGRARTTAARRPAGATISSFFSIVVLGALIFGTTALIAPAAAQTNIVVIMTDDMRLDDLDVMTETQALIGEGTTFRNNYATFPLCCPSRATFITGQYAHNHGVFANRPPNGGYTALDHTNTLAVWLQAAGYYTSHIGKYLNGYGLDTPPTLVPPGWTDWQGLVDNTTYRMYNYTINDNGSLVTYGEAEADYQTDVLADRAVETINQAAPNQPFFLSIAPVPPHYELFPTGFSAPRPAPRHEGAFNDRPLPRPPSFNEANVSDKPLFIRNLPRLTSSEIQTITTTYRARLASLLAVDDLVERVVNALADAGVLNNTVLFFTSDNGWMQGEHRIREGKIFAYEESSHVPLLIRGDGFPPGATRNQFVGNIDLAPTIVDLTDASPRRVMDGRSLLPLAQNPTLGTARDLLIETLRYEAVRNRSFVYVEHNTGERELYDMRPDSANYDPYQLQSRHADSAYSQIQSQLANRLNQLSTCSGTSCGAQ
jgi:N-acetylglucosamine-6-sulfatase